MQIHAFNTGAPYTRHGQRIAYAQLESGDIAFLDRDRGIPGMIKAPTVWPASRLDDYVNSMYLRGDYATGYHAALDGTFLPEETYRALDRELHAACDRLAKP